MKRVTMFVAPEYAELRAQDPKSWYARVEIDTTDGRTLVESTDYARGANVDGYRLTDEDMAERFRVCASVILPSHKIERAIDQIMNLEKLDCLSALMENLTL